MLSDEEREALQYFNTETKTEAMHYGAVLVKLIEKQSKEIEELKEKNNKLMEELDLTTVYISGVYDGEKKVEDKIEAKIEEKFLEAKGLHERGVQPQAQYTMKLLRDLEKSLLEKE